MRSKGTIIRFSVYEVINFFSNRWLFDATIFRVFFCPTEYKTELHDELGVDFG